MELQIAFEKKDSFENFSKLSRPSGKHLGKEKRNKRKSKIFSRPNDEQLLTDVVVNEIKVRGNIFNEIQGMANIDNSKFYTLENFEGGTENSDENIHLHGDLKKIIKEMEDNMTVTPSNFGINNCKASFSQRFKDSCDYKDSGFSSKRFKI